MQQISLSQPVGESLQVWEPTKTDRDVVDTIKLELAILMSSTFTSRRDHVNSRLSFERSRPSRRSHFIKGKLGNFCSEERFSVSPLNSNLISTVVNRD